MVKILNANSIIDNKINDLTKKSHELTKKGLTPKLSVILVGKNEASLLYIKNKKAFCSKIGAEFELIELAKDVSKEKFLNKIKDLNQDPKVTGCFVQLPVADHLKSIDITQLISPDKDVDGFHLNTVNQLYKNDVSGIIPCTPKGIITLLDENEISIEGKDITIIGRSFIVGKPLSLLLQAKNATVTLCHSKTKNLKRHTQASDIIISAVGVPHLIDRTYLNQAKNQIIIDVGMNKLNGKTVGDVNFNEVKDSVSAISPVPGGVGPMTVFSLMENLLFTTEKILNKEK